MAALSIEKGDIVIDYKECAAHVTANRQLHCVSIRSAHNIFPLEDCDFKQVAVQVCEVKSDGFSHLVLVASPVTWHIMRAIDGDIISHTRGKFAFPGIPMHSNARPAYDIWKIKLNPATSTMCCQFPNCDQIIKEPYELGKLPSAIQIPFVFPYESVRLGENGWSLQAGIGQQIVVMNKEGENIYVGTEVAVAYHNFGAFGVSVVLADNFIRFDKIFTGYTQSDTFPLSNVWYDSKLCPSLSCSGSEIALTIPYYCMLTYNYATRAGKFRIYDEVQLVMAPSVAL